MRCFLLTYCILFFMLLAFGSEVKANVMCMTYQDSVTQVEANARQEKRIEKKHRKIERRRQWEKSETGRKAALKIPMLESVFRASEDIASKKWHYESDFYFRGSLELKRKNLLVRFVPNRRFFEHGGKRLLTEMCGEMNYYDPYMFTRHKSFTYGAVPDVMMSGDDVLDFFCITLYDEYLITDHLLSPLRRTNAKCYRYRVDSVKAGNVYYTFKARRRNTQLVTGRFVFNVERQCVSRISFWGEYGFVRFSVNVAMGSHGDERYWPARSDMSFSYSYLGNKFRGQCLFTQRYKNISRTHSRKRSSIHHLDVTDQYVVSIDTTHTVIDSLAVAERRTVPLSLEDHFLYYDANRKKEMEKAKKEAERAADNDSLAIDSSRVKSRKHISSSWLKPVGKVLEMLVKRHRFETSRMSFVRISSPHISYSGWKGVSYRQDVTYNTRTDNEHEFSIRPTIGYNFRPKQFVWRLASNYLYMPNINAKISFEAGNAGTIHSAERLVRRNNGNDNCNNENENGDGVSGERILFSDVYMELEHVIEPVSGLKLLLGGVFHDRKPTSLDEQKREEWGIKREYKSFAPRFNIEYTPMQHYYRKGNRRISAGSYWPTFCIDYERGISGVFSSHSHYEKWEFTITHEITFDALHRVMMKLGGGAFSNKENADFVDYRYFYKGIVDYNWNDDVGGVFQLLDNKYYNDALHYLRGHVVYESPTMLLRNLSTRYLRGERLYLNTLLTPQLKPYLEIGYGLSSHILDLSGFASLLHGKFDKVGVKFTLHLFD